MMEICGECVRFWRFERACSDGSCDELQGSVILMLACCSSWLARDWVKARRRRLEKVIVRCERRLATDSYGDSG